MKHIRTKFIILVTCMLVACFLITGIISVFAIRKLGDESSDEKLSISCESIQESLNDRIADLYQSVETVYHFAESEMSSLSFENLQANVRLTRRLCRSISENTEVIDGYYYRVAPEAAGDTLGFWYVKDDSSGEFSTNPLTDLNGYEPDDFGHLGWYTIPGQAEEPVWLGPYVNENLDRNVVSYIAPVHFGSTFVGVIGMDMKTSTLTDLVKGIKVYDSGYAFLLDSENNLVFSSKAGDDTNAEWITDEILLEEDRVCSYNSNGTDMRIIWRPLSNGMKVFITVPGDEINETWIVLVRRIILAAAVLLLVFVVAVVIFSIGITRPLQRLTDAALKVNRGNYDVVLETKSKDEVGILTDTFRKLVDYLRDYIGDLNDKVYYDALTGLRNKGAYDAMCMEIQKKADDPNRKEPLQYALMMFDCNDLKTINDVYGHENGNSYLKKASSLICSVFAHSPVFRVGGDEFTAILQGQDYENREALCARFEKDEGRINSMANDPWDEVHVAYGIGVYDPAADTTINSVMIRADQSMYIKKKAMKERGMSK